jgi:hypothetical protein
MSIRGTVTRVAFALLCAHPLPALAQQASTPELQGFVAEPDVIERAVLFADRHISNGDITNGFYVDSWNMIPGAGWISAGPGYRHWYKKDHVFVDGSAAISWRGYKTAQARFELPRLARSRLTLGSHIRWQNFPQVRFYGEGADALETNRSEYRLRSTNLVGYATVRPVEWAGVTAQIGWLKPDTDGTVPAGVVFAVPDQPTFAHTELSMTADTRDFPGHPTRGGLFRAAVANYSDRDTGIFSFRRYDAEAAQFVPIGVSRVVLALHGWLVASDTDEGHFVPFYLQPSLGGHNTLRSYADYRFHDRHLLIFNAEARVPMMTHVDAAVFLDAGNVAARLGDLNFDKRSYGAGLRLHTRRRTFARFDVAHGGEGWQLLFRLTDPLNLARVSRRTPAVPFVP